MIEENGKYQSAEQASQYKRLAAHMRRHPPDKQWMLFLLSTLNTEHEIFKKGYRPPPSSQEPTQQ